MWALLQSERRQRTPFDGQRLIFYHTFRETNRPPFVALEIDHIRVVGERVGITWTVIANSGIRRHHSEIALGSRTVRTFDGRPMVPNAVVLWLPHGREEGGEVRIYDLAFRLRAVSTKTGCFAQRPAWLAEADRSRLQGAQLIHEWFRIWYDRTTLTEIRAYNRGEGGAYRYEESYELIYDTSGT